MVLQKIISLLKQKYESDKDLPKADPIKSVMLAKRVGIITSDEDFSSLKKKVSESSLSMFTKYVDDICDKDNPSCDKCFLLDHCVALEYEIDFHKNFKCSKCGYCCTLLLRLSELDIVRIENTGYDRTKFVDHNNYVKMIDNKCFFLKKEKDKFSCKIYSFRPNICRIYPSLDEDLKDCIEKSRI